jgi:hypothetical protein
MRRWLTRGILSLFAMVAVIGLAYLAGKGGATDDRGLRPTQADITAYPIQAFHPGRPDETRFGPLQYMGGLELRSNHPGFGGISSIRMRDDGKSFIGVTDVGDWVTGVIRREKGKPIALDNVSIEPILLTDGKRARDVGLWDVESLALDGKRAAIGIERRHSVLTFEMMDGKIKNAGKVIPVPDFVQAWPGNRGIEALGFLPKDSIYAGRLIGFSERSTDATDLSEAFVMRDDGTEPFRFQIRRRDGFDVTDLDFMPNGDLILLERFFSPIRGVGMRLRRIKTATILPNAVLEPEILLTADNSFAIDNMEGLSIHQGEPGETLFTLVSDNNFSIVQRNLLLQFRWMGE